MKKIIAALSLAFLAGIGRADSTLFIHVAVSGNKTATVDSAGVDFGTQTVGATGVLSQMVTITNTGNVPVTYGLHVFSPDPVWTAGTVQSTDTYVLRGLFNDATTPTAAAFGTGAANAITTAPVMCGSYVGDQSCTNVPPGATRGIWFQMNMPTASSVGTQRNFGIEILVQ